VKAKFFTPLPLQDVKVIDLNFQHLPGAIAVYMIPHRYGAVLVESGPGSTLPDLIIGIKKHGIEPGDITDVLLTHIHLDHAGAAGWFADLGANIHVHANGAQHLVNPEKLLNSAARIFGNRMDAMWGKFYPVLEDHVLIHEDDDVFHIEELEFRAIDTPGHAIHHLSYQLGSICFTGDVGGVRLAQLHHVRTPMVPPEFHPEVWRQSIERLARVDFRWIAPTHFGFFNDPLWQLSAVNQMLLDLEAWMKVNLPDEPEIDVLTERYQDWIIKRSLADGLDPKLMEANEAANPSWLTPLGMQRYWNKYHRNPDSENRT
jgi:glyoxylase-like metal-dependent hydrolase (beta-lactamase superfamily II)